jgi:hypothetical protein
MACSPRTWNKLISATDVASTAAIIGGSATAFGPAVIYISNGSSTDALFFTVSNVGANVTATVPTATDDGVSWQLPASKDIYLNLGSQDSTERYSLSFIMAAGKTSTVTVSAIQAQ